MARHHLAVALLPPPPLAAVVDTLRRAIGSSSLARIPPHLTLVPPVNVRAEELPTVQRMLDDAAADSLDFDVQLGPVTTFAPRTPTVHLAATGVTPSDDHALRALRERLVRGPFERPEPFPFTPHVTLERRADPDRIPAAVTALGEVAETWPVRSVHLLEHRRPEDRSPYWEPVLEVPLGPPVVVGRGGVELHLRTLGMLGPVDAALLGTDPLGPFDRPGDGAPVIVTARLAGADTATRGVAAGALLGGRVARLESIGVAAGHRGIGVGAQLLGAWCSEVAAGGAEVVVAERGEGDGFLARHGFVASGEVMVRG